MTPARASWLVALAALACVTTTAREPASVMSALALERGAHVADLAAGRGDRVLQLAEAVGPEGVVYAVEVDPAMLDELRERTRLQGRGSIVVVAGAPDDPRLPDASVDVALLIGAYQGLANRSAYFERLRRALRPGGRVEIVELPPLFGSATSAEGIQNELEALGYALVAKRRLEDWRNLLIFTPSP